MRYVREMVIKLCPNHENFIFTDFFAVKVDGSDVIAGICEEVFTWTNSRFDVTSVNFNSKIVYEDEIFGRVMIYYIFSRIRKFQRL